MDSRNDMVFLVFVFTILHYDFRRKIIIRYPMTDDGNSPLHWLLVTFLLKKISVSCVDIALMCEIFPNTKYLHNIYVMWIVSGKYLLINS